ncbi:MAG: 4Fe-4S binding protein [Proteobacteria bacterium]|nr:4Fe-4S binding protein [Pseudomonadota bacterium]
MKTRTVQTVCFSPTRTTKRLVAAVAAGLGAASVKDWDLTLRGAQAPVFSGEAGEIAVIGVPVYAGRVPAVAVQRLRTIQGRGALAVLVVTYGNRHYDDALIELADLSRELGFVPVAGGAFVAEHSFSTPELPVAQGRPDASDSDKATAFGRQTAAKILALASATDGVELEVPGNRPYKEGWNKPPLKPLLDERLCTACGECAAVCPVGAISINGVATTDDTLCIVCAACIRACPSQGRSFMGTPIAELNQKLNTHFSTRREPELFF